MEKVPREVLCAMPWGISLLSRAGYPICPSPLTYEIPAVSKVELLDLHALEHLDVAWGGGGGGKA